MTGLEETAARALARPGLLDRLARSLMLRHLSRLEQGSLVIEDAGETLNLGDPLRRPDIAARIVVHDAGAYRDFVFGGSIGGAEAYMLGKWSSPNLVDVVRLMSANIDVLNGMDDARFVGRRFVDRLFHWLNRNSEKQARRNISRHYDLSNDFFSLFLDPTMMYSAAVYPRRDADLDEAAVHKLDLICRKLELKDSDHLLEIGTGWGGLAMHAAREYGCRVTTTTISRQQYTAARQRIRDAGLEDRVEVLFEDYRDLRGRFDKLVSVEMIEAVGEAYYPQYFRGCASLLKDDGLMLLQAITIPDQRFEYAQNSVDFIQKYIFPGGSLPSHAAMLDNVRQHTDMVMVGMHEIGLDYARTLAAWRERFLASLDQVRGLGFDDTFVRMWHYYLCYCEGGFRERIIGTAQLLFAKPGWRSARG